MIASGKLRLGQGRWQVRVDADDGVRVWVNRQLIINEWVYPQVGTFAATIEQNQPGESEMEFVVEHFQNTGGANLKLAVVKE